VIQITPITTVSQIHSLQKGVKKRLFAAIFCTFGTSSLQLVLEISSKTDVVVLEISYSFACTCQTVASWSLFSAQIVAPGQVAFFRDAEIRTNLKSRKLAPIPLFPRSLGLCLLDNLSD
jgi:hypothetical protein